MPSFLSQLEPHRPQVDWPLMLRLKLERTRGMMEKAGVDAILTTSPDNVLYLTNWPRYRPSVHEGSYAALVLRDKDEPVIFCSEGDAGMIQAMEPFEDVRVLPPWTTLWPKELARGLSDYGVTSGKVAVDMRMPVLLFRELEKEFSSAVIENATPLLNQIRMVKNAEELKAFEHCLGLVEGATSTAIQMAKESGGRYTEVEVAAAAQHELLRKGCHSADLFCPSGYNTAPVHRFNSDKPIRWGEVMLVDGGGVLNGFRAEFARTVWTGGRPSAEQKRIYQTVFRGLEAAKKELRPGGRTSDVERAILEVVKEAGYLDSYGGYPYTGHGIGIRAEYPYITSRYPELDERLEPGLLVNLEPGIWAPEAGVRIEDTFLITSDGCRVLTRVPYEEDLLN